MNIVKLENCLDLDNYFRNVIQDEMTNLLQGEFKAVFENVEHPISLVYEGSSFLLWNRLRYLKGEITRDMIFDEIYKYQFDEYTRPMCADVRFQRDDNGCFRLKRLRIGVSVPCLHAEIVKKIKCPDILKRQLQLIIRHELGHLMDYLRWEGQLWDEFKEYRQKSREELDKYYDWMEEHRENKKVVDEVERTKRYHSIPMESMADQLGNVSVNDILNLQTEYDKLCEDNRKDDCIEIRIIKKDV